MHHQGNPSAAEVPVPLPVTETPLTSTLGCLPPLDTLAERVARVHGPSQPQLLVLRESYLSLAVALDKLAQRRDEAAAALDAARQLRQIRGLTQRYTPPAGACRSYRSLFAGLSELDLGLAPLLGRLADLEPLAVPAPLPTWRDAANCKHH
jgi:hypothetical protein